MDHHPTYTGSSESNSLTIPIEPSSRLHFHQFLKKNPLIYPICPNFSRDLPHIPPKIFQASIYKNPLVNIQKAIKNCHRNSWFSHSKFLIFYSFLYVYQRVFPYFQWDFFQPTRCPDKVTSPENSSLMLKQLASPNQQGINGWFGGWALPLWKMMDFVSWGDEIPNWMDIHKIHVPNHQPDGTYLQQLSLLIHR